MKRSFKDLLVFLGPLWILPGLLVAWPAAEVVLLSFKNQVLLFDIDRWVGFANYGYLMAEDMRFRASLVNTLYFT
ncbi:MAG: sugar ABC transporter permease, partial [Nitrospinaceae bacterium]|nr:sugar ABC transporter permease [Nitrospinaceae bacterium]